MLELESPDPKRDSGFGFDWSLIQSFLAVIDEGSLLAAARRTGSSQPTIGRHIDALELQLGVSLFERTGRALVPTASARHIAEIARSMEQGANRIAHAITRTTTDMSGIVRLSASRMVANYLLPDFALQIQRESPDIELAVVATDAVSNLLQRDADIAVRMVKPQQVDLIAKRLGTFALRPCASQAYIDRWGMPRTLPDLFRHRLVSPDKDKFFVKIVREIAQRTGVEPGTVKLAFRTDDFVTQAAAIRAGVGVGFLVDYLFDQDDELVQLPIELPFPGLPVWLAVHREIRSTPRIRYVFDTLQKFLRQRLK